MSSMPRVLRPLSFAPRIGLVPPLQARRRGASLLQAHSVRAMSSMSHKASGGGNSRSQSSSAALADAWTINEDAPPTQHAASGVAPRAASFSLAPGELQMMHDVENRVNWLASVMIDNANNVRPKRDGIKVGGHQASSASLVSILTALYTKVLRPQDRVAVKPHAGPVYHALQYMMGRQTRANLENFRSFGGVQPYPSRTKDLPEVDISTGSVGLGAALTSFTSLTEQYLRDKGMPPKAWPGTDVTPEAPGRHIALVGDAELDEGNVFETLLETWKLGITNNWFIVDYNRQSLDKIMEENSSRVIHRMFHLNGWEVLTLKFGVRLRAAFEQPGGKLLRKWINSCDNAKFSALTFSGGASWRKSLLADAADLGDTSGEFAALVNSYDDQDLQGLMTNLGGHCYETLLEAFAHASQTDARTMFLCYTIKGYGLPLAGHRDNHGLYLAPQQVEALRDSHGLTAETQWEPFANLPDAAAAEEYMMSSPINSVPTRNHTPEVIDIPTDLAPSVGGASPKPVSSQAAFGAVMLELSRGDSPLASRLLTMAPDVTTTTSLAGFVNKRGVYTTGQAAPDNFKAIKAPGVHSLNNWRKSGTGQHIELGIAENNLLLAMAAAGLSAEHFGHRLFPVGTLYDPFVARALDSLIYGCYMKSRFMLVGTPSGLTLAPEGGAHQSIGTPLIGMSVPNLLTYEPAFADEVKATMHAGFDYMQDPNGGAVYLRLSTRALPQIERDLQNDAALSDAVVRGGYWHVRPDASTKVVIAFSGVVAPEALAAQKATGAALLQVTSYDRLAEEWKAHGDSSYAASLLAAVPRDARLVTVLDGHPTSLSWLGGIHGHKVNPLGVAAFGQTGDLIDLYRHYKIDTDAIVRACA